MKAVSLFLLLTLGCLGLQGCTTVNRLYPGKRLDNTEVARFQKDFCTLVQSVDRMAVDNSWGGQWREETWYSVLPGPHLICMIRHCEGHDEVPSMSGIPGYKTIISKTYESPTEKCICVDLEAGKSYKLTWEYDSESPLPPGEARLAPIGFEKFDWIPKMELGEESRSLPPSDACQ